MFLLKLRIIGELLLAVILGYMGGTFTFQAPLVNVILITVSVFTLLQACDNVDKANHLGRYRNIPPENSKEDSIQETK